MPKGHSTFESRVEMLETRVNLLWDAIDDIRKGSTGAFQDKRIEALERRIAEMNEAFSNARFPRAPQQVHGSAQN